MIHNKKVLTLKITLNLIKMLLVVQQLILEHLQKIIKDNKVLKI
jgi:hypothetical protein